MGVRYTICHWAINRTDPQNSLSMTLDVPLHQSPLQVIDVTILIISQHWCLRMEKKWKNGGVSRVEESTECKRDQICLLCLSQMVTYYL